MNRPKSQRLLSQINVVPYVDVSLVLLVIFMIAAPLLSQGIVIDLPEASADPIDALLDDPLVLSVDSDGAFYLNFGGDPEQPLDEQTVLERVAAAVRRNAETPIFVRGDEGAFHGRVMRAFTLLRRAGAGEVILMTDAPDDAAP